MAEDGGVGLIGTTTTTIHAVISFLRRGITTTEAGGVVTETRCPASSCNWPLREGPFLCGTRYRIKMRSPAFACGWLHDVPTRISVLHVHLDLRCSLRARDRAATRTRSSFA